MGVCDLVRDTSNGLQNAAGKAASGLGSVLSALGAADIGIKLGTGGQAGVTDLPRLIAEEKGIECYSPELGDSIYVTPLQWYANGMKCDGLRDPDREKIKKIQNELDKKIAERQKIKRGGLNFLSQDIINKLPPELQDIVDKFADNKGLAVFGQPGILEDSYVTHYNVFEGAASADIKSIPKQHELYTHNINIFTGNYLEPYIYAGSSFVSWGINLIRDSSFSSESPERKAHLSRDPDYRAVPVGAGYGGITRVTNQANVEYIVYEMGKGNLRFIPSNPYPAPPLPPVDILYDPPKERDVEELCSMTCSCGQIGQMLKQQQRINGNIEQLIKEIHKAVAASLFVARSPYYPEQNIEKIGKQLYSGHPGRGGNASVNNLLEAVESLVSAHYHRMGLHRFPANVPDSLIPKTSQLLEAIDRDYIDIHDMAGFLEWMAKVEDERAGEWPIKFKITDDGKEKDVYLWNQAEAIADIYGALLKVVEDSDQGVHWGLRATTEASKAGNAGLKVLHLLQEIVKFSGAMTAQDFIKVKSSFTPDPMVAQTTEEMLKPSEQDLQVTNIIDGRTLLGLLLNISYWSQISGRAVYGSLDNNPATGKPHMPGDSIKEMKKKNKAADNQWDKWKAERKQPSSIPKEQQPPGGLETPDITEIQKPKQ